MTPEQEERCKRKIFQSKYEKNSLETRDWWFKLFSTLEAEAAIPPHKKFEVLEQIFPNKLLERIIHIVELENFNVEDFYAKRRSTGIPKKKKTQVNKKVPDATDSSFSTEVVEDLNQIGQKNPYLNFFKRRPDRASIWRPMPPLSLSEMNLVQKADAITEMIATDFVQWLHTMGGDNTSSQLTIPVIISMFEILFNTHAATSLCVKLKEMPTVTELMAKKRNLPEIAKRESLHRQIYRDIEATKGEPRVFAFGQTLPINLQRHPPKEDIANKWLVCKNVPIKLQTMQTVWEGITHLRSTRAFCEWLVEHPEIPPPQYLVENKMLDDTVLRANRPSAESEEINLPVNTADDQLKMFNE